MVTSNVKNEIDDLLRDWERHFNTGDTKALADLYTEDAYLMPPDSPALRGREAIASFWQKTRDSGVSEILLHIGDVIVDGDTALEISTATLKMQDSTGEVPLKYVVAWKRRADGPWQLMIDMFSGAQAA